jgi:hypothetical protein
MYLAPISYSTRDSLVGWKVVQFKQGSHGLKLIWIVLASVERGNRRFGCGHDGR